MRRTAICAFPATFAAGTIVKPATPIMGFSTWNGFQSDINESVIHEVADALAESGLLELGYEYVNLDDAWAAGQRNATGHMVAHPTKFPSGMRALADRLHGQGFKFGLYTARYTKTCGRQMPGSLGHEQLDAQTFAAYGADFVKNDDCGVVYADAAKDYGAMQDAIAAVDRPMLHNVKAPDLSPEDSPKVCQFRRVGKDLKNSWEDMVRSLDYGNDDAYNNLVGKGKGFFQDYDMLEVGSSDGNEHHGPRMTAIEQRAHFSLWAALKSPLVLGNDPRNMSVETLAILKNVDVIAVNQDPLAVPARLVNSVHAIPAMSSGTKATLRPCKKSDPTQKWLLDTSTPTPTPPTPTPTCLSVNGAGESSANGQFTIVKGGIRDNSPFWRLTKDMEIYRWNGDWRIAHNGQTVYYTAPGTGQAVPPLGQWQASAGGGPAPTVVPCANVVAQVVGRLRSAADTDLCLALWKCEMRWPWWLAAQRCDGSDANEDSGCSATDQLSWRWNEDSGSIEWFPGHQHSCWGTSAAATKGSCCMSTEGSNPELDVCGWAADTTQQSWSWDASNASIPSQLISERRDLCLTLADDLEVYAGPLQGGRATAVMLNRSPMSANITVVFADIQGFDVGTEGVAVVDLWSKQNLGRFQRSFTAEVESHGVVHVNFEVESKPPSSALV